MSVLVENNVALMPKAQAVVLLGNFSASNTPAVASSNPRIKTLGSEEIMPWGENNDFPQMIIDLVSKNTIIPPTLDFKARVLQGGGIIPCQVELVDDNKEKVSPITDKEITAFFKSNTTKRYISEAANDLFWFFNLFPEFIISKDRGKILQIHENEAAYCRWSKMNTSGICEHVYINANWPDAKASDPETIKVTAIDPYAFDLVNQVRSGKDFKYIYPLSYPTPGKTFYQLAHWDSVRTSGWLDVILQTPVYKNYIMKNQMTVKYQIKVPVEYWELKYGEKWLNAKSETERKEIMQADLDEANTLLTNPENAGKAFMSLYRQGVNETNKIPAWEIVAVDDKLKDGKFLEDNQEAQSNLFYALGVDPTIAGFAPGSKMGSGSGSDKREAFLIYINTLIPYRDRILEPLEFIAEYNGWKDRYPGFELRFKDVILTTLDQGKGTQKVLS